MLIKAWDKAYNNMGIVNDVLKESER